MSNYLKRKVLEYGISPQKKYGQNFLVDESVLDKIIQHSGKIKNKIVLEVGPGLGFLTTKILDREPKLLYSIEVDKNLEEYLRENFKNFTNFKLIHSDAMLLEESKIFTVPAKIIANLPYNISVPLIMKWLYKGELFEEMYLLVQKEVAKRIVATYGNKNYGSISIIISYLAQAEILFEVSPACFYPPPKVDSAFIKITINKNHQQKKKIIPILEKLCNALFNNRRKMIRNTMPLISKDWKKYLIKLNISECSRPEEIPAEKYIQLANLLNN